MARDIDQDVLRLARLQDFAIRRHKAAEQCRRLAREARRVEDQLLYQEAARRALDAALALDSRVRLWEGQRDDRDDPGAPAISALKEPAFTF